MAPKPPTLYDLRKTTIGFSAASIVLLIGLVMMVLQDSDREWKHWQREFMDLSRGKTGLLLAKLKNTEEARKIKELQDQLAAANREIEQNRSGIQGLRGEIAQIDLEINKANRTYQELKQNQDSDRYFFEEARAHKEEHKAKVYEERLARRGPPLETAKLTLESLQGKFDEKSNALNQILSKEQPLDREIKKLTQDVTLLESKISKLKPDWVKAVLNFPMLDFLRPTLQIQQVVVERLHDDYYFAKVQKVDRCISCHLAIDQKGFEDAPQPFKTHPHLDLFLSPDSKHPMEAFGCTSCHGGGGHSVSFTTAVHTPKNEEQAKEWEHKYRWEEMHHWAEKMLPLNHTEASCAKCHQGVVDIPKAPKLNQGRRLAQEFGCFGCHKVEGMENHWKAGPSLGNVQSKLDQDWIVRWLQNPQEFRASAKMPRIFHLSNTSEAADVEKSNASIAGIATYLIKNSSAVSLENPTAKGDAKSGEKLVQEVGCLGCHSVGSAQANHHGPELSGLGSKVKADWLYTWLKDPKHYSEETRMPNLRLSDQEAADITSYLLSNRNEKFESIRAPLVKPETVDLVATAFLTSKMRHEEAKNELAKMNPEERLEFIGRQTIAHQGCFACHTIKGFEDARPIGTELTHEGSKEIERLDFGFTPLERTRQAWFFKKLKDPRIFDQGREKPYHEKLRMPLFGFTDEQADALTTFLLSLQKAEIPLDMKRRLNLDEEKTEEGRLIAAKFNCQGCHTLDGIEGRVRSIIQDKGNTPPILEGEGKKVQARWLYRFLENPTPIRPWLKYRMPTFGFEDRQIATLVDTFNHLSDVKPSYKSEKPESAPEEIETGRRLFQTFQCIKCHQSNPDPKLSASFLAPDLAIAKDRLRPAWVPDWLKDPQALEPGTMMPTFFAEGQSPAKDVLGGDASKQIKAIRDYLWTFAAEETAAVKAAGVSNVQGK